MIHLSLCPTHSQNKNPNMKMRSKGKVYPSSSSSTPSSSPATSPAGDSLAVLTLLPAAIITLTVVLSAEDREVLAYMITRSIKSTNPSSSSVGNSNGNGNGNGNSKKAPATHKPPVFDCDCFDCYTSYWFKWDTSVNRELIHHAIEAFEETLTTNEQLKKKGKRKEKSGHRRLAGKPFVPPCDHHTPPQYDVVAVESKSKAEECAEVEEEEDGVLNTAVEVPPETTVAAGVAPASHQHKGLTRKVLPDVMGLFNWRLWSLWSPNDV